MENAISEFTRRDYHANLQTVLAELAQMIPVSQRSNLLREIYDQYNSCLAQRKTRLCETIEEILIDSGIRTLLPDKYRRGTSAHYKLRTTRLREYIRGRNRRIKDDLMCACMYAALVHNNPLASESACSKILELIVNLEERLARIRSFLEQRQPEETSARLLEHLTLIPQEDVAGIVDIALLRGVTEAQIIEFLARRFENTPFGFNETERRSLSNKIEARIQERFKDRIISESRGLRQSIMNVLERKSRPSHSDYLRCATLAYRKRLSLGHPCGERILDAFLVDVSRLVKRRSISLIDSAVDETLHMAGLRGK
jgi:hypothetical protein